MAAVKTKRKKDQPKKGKCYDCQNAYLMQSHKYNPVIALCELNKQRYVASMEPLCGAFCKRIGEAVIHPMIHLSKQ